MRREAVAACIVPMKFLAIPPGAITPQRRPGAVAGSGTDVVGSVNGAVMTPPYASRRYFFADFARELDFRVVFRFAGPFARFSARRSTARS